MGDIVMLLIELSYIQCIPQAQIRQTLVEYYCNSRMCTHSRRPRDSQSGRENRRDENFSPVVENVCRAFSPDPTDMHSNFPQSFLSEKAIRS